MVKKRFEVIFITLLIGLLIFFVVLNSNRLISTNLKDEKGCITLAGYNWDENEKECIKIVGENKIYQVRDFQACVDSGYITNSKFPRECYTPSGRKFTEKIDLIDYFIEQLNFKCIERLGAIPIDGFDPQAYLKAFPNLKETDFDNTKTVGGKWIFEKNELVFIQENFIEANSLDKMLTKEGYMQLLENLKRRLGLEAQSSNEIEEIIRVIEGELNWNEDAVILVWNIKTGEYFCAGCNNQTCIEQPQNTKTVEERADFRCTTDFELKGVSKEYIPVPQIYYDANCPLGSTGDYSLVGKRLKLIGCKPFPTDIGNICKNSDECEYNCIATKTDLLNLKCEFNETCPTKPIECEGVKGRCGGYGMNKYNIVESNKIKINCEIK